MLFTACSSLSFQAQTQAEGDSFPPDGKVKNHQNNANSDGVLKILTLNVAHGRKDAFNQMFLSAETIQKNLVDIAEVLKKENADVVALQEADGPSWWSGNFDHVATLARLSGYPWHYRADHAKNWMYSYGTAILSRWPVSETIEYTFAPSPPTTTKGFLLSHMQWSYAQSEKKEMIIDVVSVHLDFSRKKVRQIQIEEMAEALAQREQPMIILGDFNSDWFSDESVVKQLAEQAKLKVYQPDGENLRTYVSKDKRLDWILISSEWEFVSYQVLPNIISDHFAVVAEVKLRKP